MGALSCKIILTTAVILGIFIPITAVAQYKVDYIGTASSTSILQGIIGEKDSITITLFFESFLSKDADVYSVTGSYHTSKNSDLIPLTGIYDGELTLYVFADSNRADSLKHFKYDLSYFEMLGYVKKLSDFQEKFTIFNNTKTASIWTDGNKTLSLELQKTGLDLLKYHEKLRIQKAGEEYIVDLTKFHLNDHGFSLINSYFDSSNLYILLKFNYPSNIFEHDSCAVAEEFGYYTLNFSFERFEISPQRYLIASCNEHVILESTIAGADGQLIYNIKINNNLQRVITIEPLLCKAGVTWY